MSYFPCPHPWNRPLLQGVLILFGGGMVFRNKDLGIVCVHTLQSCPTLCDPVTHQAPLSMVFSRQESWSMEKVTWKFTLLYVK